MPTTLGDGYRYRQASNATPTSKNDPSGDPIRCESQSSCGTLVCVQRVGKATETSPTACRISVSVWVQNRTESGKNAS
jgi:hypothetical protein